jgi:hypothetical protein
MCSGNWPAFPRNEQAEIEERDGSRMASSARKSDNRKTFTPAEANAMLPLVRVIVQDIVSRAGDLRERQQRLESITSDQSRSLGRDHAAEVRQAEEELRRDQEALRSCVEELAALGVELKDFFSGLVDFPSRMEDRIVYLCWRLGEDTVSHWHELDAGFAGRQKLVPDVAHA